MDSQQDTTGDYGYDLVHEAARREGKPAEPTGGTEQQHPPDSRTDRDGDFGYDEAHDF